MEYRAFGAIILLEVTNVQGRVKALRKELGLTQEQFAAKLGLSRNFIAQLESGIKNPSERTVADICRVFNVNRRWLETGTGEMFYPMDEEEQLLELAEQLLFSQPDSFRKRLVSALLRCGEDEIVLLEKLLTDIVGGMTDKKNTDTIKRKDG